MRIRPIVASAAAWILGAAAAVSVGLIALSLIGTGLSDRPVQPLSPHGLGQPMNPAPGATDGVGAPATSSPSAPVADQTISTVGGTVIAGCRPAGAYLVGWSPAPGYRAQEVVRGPGEVAKLKFEGDGREVEVSVTCVDGVLRPHVEIEDDHG